MSDVTKPSVDILTICLGKYDTFFNQFYATCQAKFLPEHNKNFFVFTDKKLTYYNNVTQVHQQKLGWPYDTMMRFKMFNRIKDSLKGDYVFFFNVNMNFLNIVDEKVMPNSNNDYLMGVNHPGFYSTDNTHYPYERNYHSNFYIPPGQGKNYFQGCFNGGRRYEFLEMSNILEKKIDNDMSKDIIPVWHDESALNWYYSKKNPLVLEPSYAYPENWSLPFNKNIVQLDKNKFGGHSFLRE
jgi:hypothetical protein